MLKDIMKEIIEAENQAKTVLQEAFAEAKSIVDNADKTAERIIKEAKDYAFSDERRTIEKAEQDAEDIYNMIISEGVKKAEQMDSKIDLTREAKFITDRLMEKYGSN